jgi:hypothetical protein
MLVSLGQQQWVFLSLILLCFEGSGMMMMMMMMMMMILLLQEP